MHERASTSNQSLAGAYSMEHPYFLRFYDTRSKKGGDKDSTPFIVIGKKSD